MTVCTPYGNGETSGLWWSTSSRAPAAKVQSSGEFKGFNFAVLEHVD